MSVRVLWRRTRGVEASGGANGRELGTVAVPELRSGGRSWAKHRWHALDANLYPEPRSEYEDLAHLVREYVLTGHVPDRPLLTEKDIVITLGSCFAAELRKFLSRLDFGATGFWIPAGLNNTYALLDFVSWCATGTETDRGFRYDRFEGGEIREWTPEAEREEYVVHLRDAGAFVFTLGLAEVWEDVESGGVFWRGVPEQIFDAARHRFRVTTVDENEANLVRLVELLRSVNAGAPIILTLSPVPLRATFRDISCISADCVSKSTLRVALDRLMQRKLPGVYYWPSYEIVRWVGPHLPSPTYGVEARDARHVSRYVVTLIVDQFVRTYYGEEAAAVFAERLRTTGPPPAPPTGVRRKARWLSRAMRRRLGLLPQT
jgi:GSCFA family